MIDNDMKTVIGRLTKTKKEHDLAPCYSAEGCCVGGELDHYEPWNFNQHHLKEFYLIKINLKCKMYQIVGCASFHNKPPDGEGEGEPGGDGVDHHGEVGVEHHEDPPTERVLVQS